ncbi:hypothetical protein E4U31_005565 [Claviceps sp. LM219 group G6]|nr:hypothetical protein E4U15_003953 [Claviceps sp. LM218 group G6]KAG6110592.1 hypothetical protein E4U31_005565 [Claviceps sp. LM219 group G6]KAG6120788.1 hypothetical protein E4U14_003071 [Claviceps sp. LM454 group G7]
MRTFVGAFSCFALVIGILAASDDAIKALAMVNQARQAHGVPGLAWDTGLEAYAQFWANEMASGRSRFEHAQGPNRPSQGENLYEQSAGQCDAAYDNPLQTGMHAWLSQEHFYTGQPITTGHEPWLHWVFVVYDDEDRMCEGVCLVGAIQVLRCVPFHARRKYRWAEAVLNRTVTGHTLTERKFYVM